MAALNKIRDNYGKWRTALATKCENYKQGWQFSAKSMRTMDSDGQFSANKMRTGEHGWVAVLNKFSKNYGK